jgi:hypothetical protein
MLNNNNTALIKHNYWILKWLLRQKKDIEAGLKALNQ